MERRCFERRSSGSHAERREWCGADLSKLLRLEQALELVLRLLEPRPVRGVHDEDDAVHGREVVFPDPARGLVAAEVKGPEADLPDDKPWLKGSVGEGPNQTNYSDRSSVRILAKLRNFR